MRRKVVKQGPTTMMVSLPKRWLERCGVKRGDEVEVKESGTTLLVSKSGGAMSQEASIQLKEKRYVRSVIGRFYKARFTRLTVSYASPDMFPLIQQAVNTLIGAEITDIGMNRCVIRILPIEECGSKIDKDMVKMLITLKVMLGIMQDDMRAQRFGNVETMHELRNNNWRLRDFITRTLVLKNAEPVLFNNITHIIFCYEKIGTKLYGFYKRHLSRTKRSQKKQSIKQAGALVAFIDTLIKLMSGDDFSTTAEAALRDDILAFNVSLFKGLARPSQEDGSFAALAYLAAELLDSCVSYLFSHRARLEKRQVNAQRSAQFSTHHLSHVPSGRAAKKASRSSSALR